MTPWCSELLDGLESNEDLLFLVQYPKGKAMFEITIVDIVIYFAAIGV